MGSCLSTSADSSSASSSSRKKRKQKKSSSSGKGSIRKEESFGKVAGRRFSNGSSDFASLFTQQGKKGVNQDAMIVWENFCSRNDTIFCGVFDGHGPFGHLVAKRVRDSLPQKLSSHLGPQLTSESKKKGVNLKESTSHNIEETFRSSIDPDIFLGLKHSFLKAFKVMDKELRVEPNIDCYCSGTTAVTLLKQGHDLIIGNVGDSRAILGTRDQEDRLIAVQLTVDLKPNLPKEAERIRSCKGRVFALQDEPEVARVWLPNNNSPGLAMARAFGDFCLKDFGLISVPDVSYRRTTERDEFIVLATDGIWDVLSNEEVVSIISLAPARSYAARSLVEAAVQSWKVRYPTSRVDDCAVICLFLNSESKISSASTKESSYTNLSSNSNESDHEEMAEPNVSFPTSLDRSGTVRSDNLESVGVSRVDTMLALPRFIPEIKR